MELKTELLKESGNTYVRNGDCISFDINHLQNMDRREIAANLFSSEGHPLDRLKEELRLFNHLVQTTDAVSEEIKSLSNSLLDQSGEDADSWLQKEFPSYTLAFVFDALGQIEANVRFLSNEC
jgi:hypothetical protein